MIDPVEGLRWRGCILQERGWGRTRAGRWLIDGMLLPADVRQIRTMHRRVFGRNPRLLFPKTFNEKIQRAKLLSRRARYRVYADKIAVRDYVRDRLGPEVLTDLLWTGVNLSEARALKLPGPYIIKANHGNGANLIVRDPAACDWGAAEALVKKWFSRRYDRYAAEWPYRWIEPRLLIESLLISPYGGSLPDYKFFCFHGRVQLIQVDMDRFTNHTRVFLDREGKRLPVGLLYKLYPGEVRVPDCLPLMIEYAETLAGKEPFIRIDFYDVGRPVFGEITLYPEAGLGTFDPPEWDERLGGWW